MLIQRKSTGEFQIVEEFNSITMVNYNDNAYAWSIEAPKLTTIKIIRGNLKRINDLKDWSEHRDRTKTILAQWFCTSQENIDSLLDKEEQIVIIQKSYAIDSNEYSHECNGKNYFNRFRSELVYDYKHEIKSALDIYSIESQLQSVTTKLLTGDWMSAKALLETFAPSGALTQEIINHLSDGFTSYISDNY